MISLKAFVKPKNKKKKIGIFHYRVGGTDGVALEIQKRKEILQKYDCEVRLIAGPRSKKADHTIKELEWDDGIMPIIKENGFIHFNKKNFTDKELKREMKKVSDAIKSRLKEIQRIEKFDHILVHNIFSFGGHTAAAKPFAEWINKYKIPCLATHHDFYWERKEYNLTRSGYIREYMKEYMPPKSKYISHVVINSLAQKELKNRAGIEAEIMGDVFDFNQSEWEKREFNKEFLKRFEIRSNDLVILQATRILPRKGIEIAIDYANALSKKIKKLEGKTLYNGKKISEKSKVILVFAGYAEKENKEYLLKLKSKIFDSQLPARFISEDIDAKRALKDGKKSFSLWDAYVHSDIVTFPSLWEGWGNQFIEAIFAKRPIAMYEYPVYRKDIAIEGYKIISLGCKHFKDEKTKLSAVSKEDMKKSIKKTMEWILNKDLEKILEDNFGIGRKHHDYNILERFLVKKIGLKKKSAVLEPFDVK